MNTQMKSMISMLCSAVVAGGAGGCAGYRETVVKDSKGNELRGAIIGGPEACGKDGTEPTCRVRIAGGSILVVPRADVVEVTSEARARDDTSHGGQFGLLASPGISGGVSVGTELALASGMPLTAALTYASTDALELDLGYQGLLLGSARAHYGTFGARYFLVPHDPIKYYTGATLLVGTGVGVHTRTGYQWDVSRNLGLFIETGLTVAYGLPTAAQPSGAFTVFVDAQLGLHLRLGK
jgi:hypothetical protein